MANQHPQRSGLRNSRSEGAKTITPREEMRDRIQSTLLLYPGIKNGEELSKKKAQEGQQRLRAAEAEYWAWKDQMKSKVEARWKMPEDTLLGKTSADEYIMEKVEKAQKSMAETASNYKAWVKEMEKKRQEELTAKLQERQRELKNFGARKLEVGATREAGLAEDREKRAQQAGRYWTWLSDTKNNIAKREVTCAPFNKTMCTGVRSAEDLTQMKRQDLALELESRQHEYSKWIESIKKPKLVMPLNKCNSVQEREIIIAEKAKKGVAQLNQTTVEYNKWLKDMEQQHHERQMAKVKEKISADQDFCRKQEAAKAGLHRKMQDARQHQQLAAQESQKAVRDMYDRVQSKPLLVEQAYRFGRYI